jgi:hypothetical protein
MMSTFTYGEAIGDYGALGNYYTGEPVSTEDRRRMRRTI